MDAIEKRARALLDAELRKLGLHEDAHHVGCGADLDRNDQAAINAISAAITPPEGYVLVPVELLRMVIGCAYPVSTDINQRGYAWSEAYLDQVLPSVKAALAAARPEVPS